jgi:hypothetical protein
VPLGFTEIACLPAHSALLMREVTALSSNTFVNASNAANSFLSIAASLAATREPALSAFQLTVPVRPIFTANRHRQLPGGPKSADAPRATPRLRTAQKEQSSWFLFFLLAE